MNPILKEHIINATQTFVTTFLIVVGATLQNGVEWTVAFWSGVLLSAALSAMKEVFARFAPMSFGGRRGTTMLGVRK